MSLKQLSYSLFSTLPPWEKVDYIIVGGRKYHYVKIGNQLWTNENLDYKIDGIPLNPSSESSGIGMWYYNNNEAKYGIDGLRYGLLYSGGALDRILARQEELFPNGFHIPSLSEFDTLKAFVNSDVSKLKSVTWNGTDDYGFNALPAGYRRTGNSSFSSAGSVTWFWSSDKWYREGAYLPTSQCIKSSSMYQDYWHSQYSYGSIRLVKSI